MKHLIKIAEKYSAFAEDTKVPFGYYLQKFPDSRFFANSARRALRNLPKSGRFGCIMFSMAGQFRTCVPYFMLASDNRETFVSLDLCDYGSDKLHARVLAGVPNRADAVGEH